MSVEMIAVPCFHIPVPVVLNYLSPTAVATVYICVQETGIRKDLLRRLILCSTIRATVQHCFVTANREHVYLGSYAAIIPEAYVPVYAKPRTQTLVILEFCD